MTLPLLKPMASNKNEALRGVRGMNDILPADEPLWQRFEDTVAGVMSAYAYRRIRTPILEHTRLFVRGIGEVTDIVEKEMYSFTDALNGEHLPAELHQVFSGRSAETAQADDKHRGVVGLLFALSQ